MAKTGIAPSESVGVRGTSEVLVEALLGLGVRRSFGILGGAVLPIFSALRAGGLEPTQFRHENGAVFAAIEHALAGGGPVAVFTTTGPGLTNALTGVEAARAEGAKLLLLSGATSARRRGRHAFQPTSPSELGQRGLFADGGWFDLATCLEGPEGLEPFLSRLAVGFAQPGAFIAHLCLPIDVQSMPFEHASARPRIQVGPPTASLEELEGCSELIRDSRTVFWLGAGGHDAAAEIRDLVDRVPKVRVMCSPRGKGIFPASDPRFLGVTGFGGHETLVEDLQAFDPHVTVVLGSKLGEFTSFWDARLLAERVVHVDVDPRVFGAAFPRAHTLGIVAELSAFARDLAASIGHPVAKLAASRREPPARIEARSPEAGRVRPSFLMQTLQELVVVDTQLPVMSEAGNAFVWATRGLAFEEAGRYRTSMGFGSMGHFCAGVIGAALARGGPALAIVGDGAMLMTNEVPTAVQLGVHVIWVVLNDARLGLVDDGMQGLGYEGGALDMPETDFASWAHAMGALGIRVDEETSLDEALRAALDAGRPVVIDVAVDRNEPAPFGARNESIAAQSAGES